MAVTIREHEPLAAHTVFKIGGPARFFAETEAADDLVAAIRAAENVHMPWQIIGAGSNVLVADSGFDGMIIHPKNGTVRIREGRVEADAAVSMARVVAETVKAGLAGFEWAIGVPGTIGGSVYGNAGCFGGEMKDVIQAIHVFNTKTEVIEVIPASAAEFGYRTSMFKQHPELVILAATLQLQPGNQKESERKVWEYTSLRVKSQDIGSQCAGCIFKNISWKRRDIDQKRMLAQFPELEQFRGAPGISAGFLIEHAGLKGRALGGAKISERHANFIVNTGGATAESVMILIGIAKEYVHRAYHILLEEEIRYIGMESATTAKIS